MGGGKLFKNHCSFENSRHYAVKRFLCYFFHCITNADAGNHRPETFIRHSAANNKSDEKPERNRKGNN